MWKRHHVCSALIQVRPYHCDGPKADSKSIKLIQTNISSLMLEEMLGSKCCLCLLRSELSDFIAKKLGDVFRHFPGIHNPFVNSSKILRYQQYRELSVKRTWLKKQNRYLSLWEDSQLALLLHNPCTNYTVLFLKFTEKLCKLQKHNIALTWHTMHQIYSMFIIDLVLLEPNVPNFKDTF